MATIAEMFYLVDAGEGRWTIWHQYTDEMAGTLVRTAHGLLLGDAEGRIVGDYQEFEEALRGLYETV